MTDTTIRISKETKAKLEKMRGNRSITSDGLIMNLLKQTGGVWVDDVEFYAREQIALVLKYYELDNVSSLVECPIFYSDLKENDEGTVFENYADTADSDYYLETAEIISKRGDDVVLMVYKHHCRSNGKIIKTSSVLHLNIF